MNISWKISILSTEKVLPSRQDILHCLIKNLIITQIPNVIDLSLITSRFAPKAAPIVCEFKLIYNYSYHITFE